MEEDTLIHYGVLGMKWGVRKQKKSSSLGRQYKKEVKAKKKAKKDISTYGGKKKAIKALNEKADRKAKAKAVAKNIAVKGGAYISSLGSLGQLLSIHGVSSIPIGASTSAQFMAGLAPFLANPLTWVYGGVGASAAVAATAYKAKKNRSKKDNKRIENVKKYG